MDTNPDDPSLEDIINSNKVIIKNTSDHKNIDPEKNSRQRSVYRKLRERGHDKKSARKISGLAMNKKRGLNQALLELIASQTVGGTNEDSIDTASDIIGLNPDNVKRWNIWLEWGMNYASAVQVEWLVRGVSTASEAMFNTPIPEDVIAYSNPAYMWMRYGFTVARQGMWSFQKKYVPSYLSIVTPSTAVFYIPSLAYEGWLMLRRNVLNAKENAMNGYHQMKEYLNGKTKNGNGHKTDDNLPKVS